MKIGSKIIFNAAATPIGNVAFTPLFSDLNIPQYMFWIIIVNPPDIIQIPYSWARPNTFNPPIAINKGSKNKMINPS